MNIHRFWTKSGEIQEWRNCVPLRYNFYQGTRQMKLLDSRQIRQVRDVCIFEINGLEVFLGLLCLIISIPIV